MLVMQRPLQGNERHPLSEKSVTGNGNKKKKKDGDMFYVIFFSGLQRRTHACTCFSLLSPPPNYLHPTTLLSSPFLEWCICMEITGTSGSFQGVRFHHLFFGVFIIYLSKTPAPIHRLLKCKRERESQERALLSKWDCYQLGFAVVIGAGSSGTYCRMNDQLLSAGGEKLISFSSAACACRLNLLFSLYQFSFQYLSHLIGLSFLWQHFHFLYFHLSYFLFLYLSLQDFDLLSTSVSNSELYGGHHCFLGHFASMSW